MSMREMNVERLKKLTKEIDKASRSYVSTKEHYFLKEYNILMDQMISIKTAILLSEIKG